MKLNDHHTSTHPDLAAVETALGQLRQVPPVDLTEKIFASWCRVQASVGELYVSFSDMGVSFVRTVDAVGPDDADFRRLFRVQFGRPLRPARRPPAGLMTALRTGRPGRLSFDLRAATDFERDVLNATRRIPRGQTRPYSWIAREIGRPQAVRAVGTALGRNPVPLLLPCHRVVRADGDPGQYIFGAAVKERLLRMEDVNLDEVAELAGSGILFLGSDTTGIVCFPTCHHARRITLPHRAGFRSMNDAMRAGYRPCLHCRPAVLAA